ncbi:MAG: hypothetical protein LBJ03_01850 [Holosporales bacterium]|jgi:hypothetical protein|nr:hypothetical protein [Holosporales bacterium]
MWQKALVVGVGGCLLASGCEQVLGARLSVEELAILKAQLKAEILAEIRAEQAKEKHKTFAESKKHVEKIKPTETVAIVDDNEKSAAKPVRDGKYKGHIKSESMKTYWKFDGRVAFNASYANHPTGQGYATSNIFSDLKYDAAKAGTNDRAKEFRCGAKNSRLSFSTITPVAWGEDTKDFKTRLELDLNGKSDSDEQVTNAIKPRCRHVYVSIGPLLIGQTSSLFAGSVSGMIDGIDVTSPAGDCCIRQPQIRYTYDFPDKSKKWMVAMENPETDGIDKGGGQAKKYDANRSNSLDIVPDLVSKFICKLDGMELSFAGLLRRLRIRHKDNKFSSATGYGLGAEGKFYLTELDTFTAALRVGNGAGRYICDGAISGVYVKNAGDYSKNDIDKQKSLGTVLAIQHYWNKANSIRSNLGIGFAYAALADDLKKNKVSALKHGYSVHANLVWTPVPDVLELGVEYVYGYAWMASEHHIIVNRLACGLTYMF